MKIDYISLFLTAAVFLAAVAGAIFLVARIVRSLIDYAQRGRLPADGKSEMEKECDRSYIDDL